MAVLFNSLDQLEQPLSELISAGVVVVDSVADANVNVGPVAVSLMVVAVVLLVLLNVPPLPLLTPILLLSDDTPIVVVLLTATIEPLRRRLRWFVFSSLDRLW